MRDEDPRGRTGSAGRVREKGRDVGAPWGVRSCGRSGPSEAVQTPGVEMARSCGIQEMGGAEQGVGLSRPDRTPHPRLFPTVTSAPQELPCSVPIPGAVGAWPCCCRIGSGMERGYSCGSAVGAGSHPAPQGAMVEGGCCPDR